MSLKTWNILLLGALAATGLLNWIGPSDAGRLNFEYFPDMARSSRYNTFAPNPNYPDGQTLQQPVAGTIPTGFPPLSYRAAPENATRTGQELQNPFSATDAGAVRRGQSVFASFCEPCHGRDGTGTGPVARRGFPPPPTLLTGAPVTMKDGELFHVVTYGLNNMPSYATQIPPDDRWKAILYVRRLQEWSGGSK